MLVTLKEILEDTRKKQYAVGLFNCVTLEMVIGIIKAAEESHSPVIIGPAEILLPNGGLEEFAAMMKAAAIKAKVPVALHLDHGIHKELVLNAMKLGFSSVMYDCSTQSFEENSKNVREMAQKAHSLGISLEAELGHVGANYNPDDPSSESLYTLPIDARRFAEETGCDALAVAIGTAHGVYKNKPVLDINRLSEIATATEIPLVLHGGSGLSDDDFAATVKHGISKINIYTDNNLTAGKAAYEGYKEGMGAYELMPIITNAVMENTRRYMNIFKSEGKA